MCIKIIFITPSLLFYIFNFILEVLLMNKVVLVSGYIKVIQLYICMHLFFFKFFFHIGYYRELGRVPCAIE